LLLKKQSYTNFKAMFSPHPLEQL